MTIIITISKGAVQSLTGLAPGQVVEIHDYDVLDVDAPDIRCDEEGDCYQEMRFEGEPAEDSEPGKRLRVCTKCGSTDIVHDAWAEWSELEQQWVLQDWFDMVYCKDCDDITDAEPGDCEEIHGHD